MSYIGVEGWFYLSMDMRIKNSIYGVECSKRQELCKIYLDCRYDILSLDSVQKGHERWEALCDDYQHPRFCTVYRALKTWISSWSGSHESPITTTNLGGWYGVSTPSVRSVSRPIVLYVVTSLWSWTKSWVNDWLHRHIAKCPGDIRGVVIVSINAPHLGHNVKL